MNYGYLKSPATESTKCGKAISRSFSISSWIIEKDSEALLGKSLLEFFKTHSHPCVLISYCLSDLAKSFEALVKVFKLIRKHHIRIVTILEGFDSHETSIDSFMTMMVAFNKQLDKAIKRQKKPLAEPKVGRPSRLTKSALDEAARLRIAGWTFARIARKFRVHASTIIKALQRHNQF